MEGETNDESLSVYLQKDILGDWAEIKQNWFRPGYKLCKMN